VLFRVGYLAGAFIAGPRDQAADTGPPALPFPYADVAAEAKEACECSQHGK
jgi:hypothetical protein